MTTVLTMDEKARYTGRLLADARPRMEKLAHLMERRGARLHDWLFVCVDMDSEWSALSALSEIATDGYTETWKGPHGEPLALSAFPLQKTIETLVKLLPPLGNEYEPSVDAGYVRTFIGASGVALLEDIQIAAGGDAGEKSS